MDRLLCWIALAIAVVLLLVFGADLFVGYPFGGGAAMGGGFGLFGTFDLVGIIACGLTMYLAVSTVRELR